MLFFIDLEGVKFARNDHQCHFQFACFCHAYFCVRLESGGRSLVMSEDTLKVRFTSYVIAMSEFASQTDAERTKRVDLCGLFDLNKGTNNSYFLSLIKVKRVKN